MGTTNMLLREILQEIRDVKKDGIPQKVVSLSSPTGPIRNGWAVVEPAKKGDHKGKPRWYKADTEEYTYDFPALSPLASPSAVASAGGHVNNVLSNFEKERLASSKKAPTKVLANDLVLNPLLDVFIDKEGNCYRTDLDETTLEPIPDMSRIIGRIRPGVDREAARESNFTAAKANSRKRKNYRNRTRKN